MKRKLPRDKRISVMLNESELRALDQYCKRYHVSNRSHFIRQTLMKNVLKRFEEDSPTLFDI